MNFKLYKNSTDDNIEVFFIIERQTRSFWFNVIDKEKR